jgi:predicted nucleic acid-binding protein
VAAKEGWAAVYDNPSLLNDALLAASCREAGITLVTNDGGSAETCRSAHY